MRILLVATAAPDPTGSGWNRRAYQVMHDLEESCNADVVVYNARQALEKHLPQRPRQLGSLVGSEGIRWLRNRLAHKARKSMANPLRSMRRTDTFSTNELHGSALAHFRKFAKRHGPFDAVVCDNAMYANAVRVMASQGVPCYYALHHIESLHNNLAEIVSVTTNAASLNARWNPWLQSACLDLAEEMQALSRAQRVFAISRLEQEFLTATGIPAEYYPYEPRGGTLEWCMGVQSARMKQAIASPHIFLYSGTPTGHNENSFALVLRELAEKGMPKGTQLVVTGTDAETLSSVVPELSLEDGSKGIRVAGMVSQAEFERLLTSATAMLIPKYFGFGALTRFADAAACGIPVITNVHPRISGLDRTQSIVVAEPGQWREAIDLLANNGGNVPTATDGRARQDEGGSPLREVRKAYEAGAAPPGRAAHRLAAERS